MSFMHALRKGIEMTDIRTYHLIIGSKSFFDAKVVELEEKIR